MDYYGRHYNEILTDNTQIHKCEQCKDCILRDDGTVWSNQYDKTSCRIYPYPAFKPLSIIHNQEKCKFRKTQ